MLENFFWAIGDMVRSLLRFAAAWVLFLPCAVAVGGVTAYAAVSGRVRLALDRYGRCNENFVLVITPNDIL